MKVLVVLFSILCVTLTGCNFLEVTEDPLVIQYRQEAEKMEDVDLFYYKQLNEEEQAVYKTLSVYIKSGEADVVLDHVTNEVFTRAYTAFSYDHPECFWLASEFQLRTQEDLVTGISFSAEEDYQEVLDKLHQKAEEIVSEIPEDYNAYQKTKYLYDQVLEMTEYQEDAEYNQDIRSVLLQGESVCAGYAKTFQFLCGKAGIEAVCVSGFDMQETAHMWNLVRIDDAYYWIDTTWDDSDLGGKGEGQYHHFLLTDKEMFETHRVDGRAAFQDYVVEEKFEYPSCTDNSYNYYKQKGCYFETYNRNTIESHLEKMVESEQYEGIGLKFQTEDECQKAYKDLFGSNGKEGNLLSFIEDELGDQGWREVSAKYTHYESINYIVIDLEVK